MDDDDTHELDAAAIRGRRQRFVALALGGVTAAAVAGCQPCLSYAEPEPTGGDEEPPARDDGDAPAPDEQPPPPAPTPCLSVAPG